MSSRPSRSALLVSITLSLWLSSCRESDEISQDAPPNCTREAGSLPDLGRPAGAADPSMPVEHIVVIMQENHSFDNYLGRLNAPGFYEGQIDGIPPNSRANSPDVEHSDLDSALFHETHFCTEDMGHSWNSMHRLWNQGKNDRFAELNGKRSLGYYDSKDLPYYYSLANEFAIADRYFASVLSQTFPNRYFLMAGTAFGHVRNDDPKDASEWSQKTIFDVLDAYGISWKYYTDAKEGYVGLFRPLATKDRGSFATIAQYTHDTAAGTLPQVAFLDSDYEANEDEHPADDIRIGEAWVAERINSLLASPAWSRSALFFTYDENGGFYDHVAPPRACLPDGIDPELLVTDVAGTYDRLGFRVPFIAISPFVKHHYVSHQTYDHTSLLKFIETKWNLPALTRRDANAHGLLELFDFAHPSNRIPALPEIERPTGPCRPNKD